MKRLTIIFLLATVLSCSQKVEDIQLLNGYWEIEKVIINGETKEYAINEVIEKFVCHDSLDGYRLKYRIQPDGLYGAAAIPETFNLKKENNT